MIHAWKKRGGGGNIVPKHVHVLTNFGHVSHFIHIS